MIRDEIWITATGKRVPVEVMNVYYLRKVLRMLIRKSRRKAQLHANEEHF